MNFICYLTRVHQKVWGKWFLMLWIKKKMRFNKLYQTDFLEIRCACPTLFDALHSWDSESESWICWFLILGILSQILDSADSADSWFLGFWIRFLIRLILDSWILGFWVRISNLLNPESWSASKSVEQALLISRKSV